MLVHVPPSLELKLKKKAGDSAAVLFLLSLAYGVWLIVKGLYIALRAPLVGPVLLVMAGTAGLWAYVGWRSAAGLVGLVLVVLAGLILKDPGGFRAAMRVRRRYLRKYWPKWQPAMRAAKLTSLDPAKPTEVPKLVGVAGNDYVDTLTARMLPGQEVKFYVTKSRGIGQTLGASGCRAVENARNVHFVDLWLWHDDPLKKLNPQPFPIPEPPADEDWYRWFQRNMLYGIREDGAPVGIDLTQRHWLIVGKSRAGKSTSRVWPVVRMSVPMVQAKRLRYCVCDFKEGMELRAGKPIFEQNGGWFAETIPEAARLLRAEEKRMLAQAHEIGLRADTATDADGIARKLDQLTDELPWTLVVVDELKSILIGNDYPEDRQSIVRTLIRIQQIGLACGYTHIGGSQQGHKDVLGPLRDGYTALDCLAVEYMSETHMLFEKDIADQYMITPHNLFIPEPEDPDQRGDQGIGWQRNPGKNYPRVRGSEVTNEHIWEIRQMFPGDHDPDEPAPTSEPVSQPETSTSDPEPEPEPEPQPLRFSRAPRR
jgi:hypothetical protein